MNSLEETDTYSISSPDDTAVLLSWKPVDGLTAADFASGIANFAKQCQTHKPGRAVIDARQLDQTSQAAAWLRAQTEVDGLDPYQTWWETNIVPLYNEATIDALAVATGDPNAPGPIPTPETADFAVGYFTDLDTARTWKPA